MAATPSIRVVKRGFHAGDAILWGNRYHFNGGTPADNTHWDTLFDNVVNAEKAILDPTIQIQEVLGYAAGSSVPVHTKAYTTDGTGVFLEGGVTYHTPYQTAALIRYATAARSSKNHPVYLFNYYHSPIYDFANGADILNPTQKTAMEGYATAWIAGFSDGTNTYNRAGPNGASATARLVENILTHRDFPT